jgi:hypothetical protein
MSLQSIAADKAEPARLILAQVLSLTPVPHAVSLATIVNANQPLVYNRKEAVNECGTEA